MKKLLVSLIALGVLSACGSSSPSGPVMLPTTVEYMGETVGGDVVVQTGKIATFRALDADGNLADSTSLTTLITDRSGTSIDYGTKESSTEETRITQFDYFPNTESQYIASFYYGDTLLNSFPIKVSVSEDDFQSADYTFTDPMTVFVGGESTGIAANFTENNRLFISYENDLVSGSRSIAVSRKLEANSTSFEGPFTAIQHDGTSTTISHNFSDITALDSDTAGNETVAVAWLAYDTSTNSDCGVVNGCQNYYHYVQFSNDGGKTFGTPVLIHQANMILSSGKTPSQIGLKFDPNGLLHAVYVSSTDGANMNFYYTTCTSTVCNGGTQVNSVAGSANSNYGGTSPIGIYVNSDGSTTIYAGWIDNRNSHPIIVVPITIYSGDYYAAKITNTGGTISVGNESRINSNTDAMMGLVTLTVDREGDPVFSWTELTLDSTSMPGSNIYVYQTYLAKSIDELASLRNVIPISTNLTTQFSMSSRIAVDASNYYHVTYLFGERNPVTYEMIDNIDLKYTMGQYQVSDSGTDTFDATPAKDIISDQTISGVANMRTTNDSAGRAYLIWVVQPDKTTMLAIEGNINTP